LSRDPNSSARTDEVLISAADGKELIVGKSATTSARYRPEEGLDYAIVRVFPEFWGSRVSMNVFVLDNPNDPHSRLVPVGHPQSPDPDGGEVCFWGGYSHHVCGKFFAFSPAIAKPRPWGKKNLLLQNVHNIDYFQHMALVALTTFTRAQVDQVVFGDSGAPVYVPSLDADDRIVRVHPTGIFFSYCGRRVVIPTAMGMVSIPLQPSEACFFYQPLDRILANEPNLELIISPKAKN
jgi:hypothetical protein